jgi:hypothetical protein
MLYRQSVEPGFNIRYGQIVAEDKASLDQSLNNGKLCSHHRFRQNAPGHEACDEYRVDH